MQYIPKLITTIGLTFDIVGVILVAYDLFWGPGNKFQTEVLKTQLKTEIFLHKSILSDYSQLSQSIGESRAAPHINQENDRHGTAKKKLMNLIKERQSEYPNRVRLWGFRGLILVVIGFILQMLGTVLN
jgi:hypothetical protein